MFVTDSAVSAGDRALDIAEGCVDPLERGVQGGLATGSGDDRLMDASGLADSGKAAQSVTDNDAGGIETALRERCNFGTAETLHPAQLQADRLTLWCGFDHRHDRRFARRTTATLATVTLAAEIGVVDLDPSCQALCGIPLHHCLHEFVLDLPSRGLGNAEPAAQLDAGDTALALGEVVHSAKPSTQRHLGRGENGPGDQGCLSPTGSALVKRAGLDEAVMVASAHRTGEARWPAPARHHLSAQILGSVQNGKLSLTEALLKLNRVARHRKKLTETAVCSRFVPRDNS